MLIATYVDLKDQFEKGELLYVATGRFSEHILLDTGWGFPITRYTGNPEDDIQVEIIYMGPTHDEVEYFSRLERQFSAQSGLNSLEVYKGLFTPEQNYPTLKKEYIGIYSYAFKSDDIHPAFRPIKSGNWFTHSPYHQNTIFVSDAVEAEVLSSSSST